jgi:hypothetical protein
LDVCSAEEAKFWQTEQEQMKSKADLAANPNVPSRREIASACRRIQSAWSDNERRKRAGLPKAEAWNPPTIRANQLGADVELETDS